MILAMTFLTHLTAQELDNYKWQNRLLLIFTPTEQSDQFEEQFSLFSEKQEGIVDRDLLIIHVSPEGGKVNNTKITSRKAGKLYDRFDLPKDSFNLLLIGKDGGVKLRKREITPTQPIFDLIDSMPMRQREMKWDGDL